MEGRLHRFSRVFPLAVARRDRARRGGGLCSGDGAARARVAAEAVAKVSSEDNLLRDIGCALAMDVDTSS